MWMTQRSMGGYASSALRSPNAHSSTSLASAERGTWTKPAAGHSVQWPIIHLYLVGLSLGFPILHIGHPHPARCFLLTTRGSLPLFSERDMYPRSVEFIRFSPGNATCRGLGLEQTGQLILFEASTIVLQVSNDPQSVQVYV
ncbi:hypothetical protein SAMN06295998_11260 [Primorskyibacter flagellatus]|uniref:Uncharacterized protein n=1 Tax=Primorskyibacter flagellatus TaxID=1387277 RepID=A0A1W2DAW7_9RHOB|nr:hypothetical protein SAMN06295998_11260 [Primorskyibacter flagellatus]